MSREKELSAGFLLGLAFFKFQLVLPIAFLFLCWRRWRFCIALAATVIATMIASLLLVGWDQMALFVHSLAAMSTGLNSQASQLLYGISPADMPNLRGLVYGLLNGHLSGATQQAIISATSLFLLGLVATINKPKTGAEAMPLAITTSAIVSYHLLAHDWSILLIPILAHANRIRCEENLSRGISLDETVVLMMFLAPLLLTFGRNYFYLGSLPLLSFLMISVRYVLKKRHPADSKFPFSL
jgi:hypothetical protein